MLRSLFGGGTDSVGNSDFSSLPEQSPAAPDVEAPALSRSSRRGPRTQRSPRVVGKASRGDEDGQLDVDPVRRGMARPIEGVLTISVVRSRIWNGEDEEVLKVEIEAGRSLAALKRRICQLVHVPVDIQRLQRTGEIGGDSLSDSDRVSNYTGQSIYLLPEADAIEARMGPEMHEMLQHERALDAELSKDYENQAIFEKSLEDASYTVNFVHAFAVDSPRNQKVKERKITLEVDALKLVADVTAMAEIEFFGVAGREPVALVHKGRFLPPDMPIYCSGISDGDKIQVVTQDDVASDSDSDSSEDSLNAGMMAWAASSCQGVPADG